MAKDFTKVISKLDRPPSGPNWVRFIHDTTPRTTKAILTFAKGQPPFTYLPAYAAMKDRIQLGIDFDTALRMTQRSGAPIGRPQNADLVRAFFEYDETRHFSALNPIEFEREWFRISREVAVPVAPLSVIRENGKFVPIFVCGWSSLPLTLMQRRLLVTIYEDAFLSLTDYQNSPAEFLFFPKADGLDGKRAPEVWRRGDYQQLTPSELSECVETFLLARADAREVLLAEMAANRAKHEHEIKDDRRPFADDDLFGRKG